MGKKSWIVFSILCVVIIVVALVLMLVLIPQVKSTGIEANPYESITKSDYTFTGEFKDAPDKEYEITSKDVSNGLKTDKYEEGNINPFTPKGEVTIYNEPTLKNEGSTTLTPDSK